MTITLEIKNFLVACINILESRIDDDRNDYGQMDEKTLYHNGGECFAIVK